jgi:hypothetical protein
MINRQKPDGWLRDKSSIGDKPLAGFIFSIDNDIVVEDKPTLKWLIDKTQISGGVDKKR